MGIVVIVFLILLAIGMPVAFAIGIAGVCFFLQHPELPFSMAVQLPISQTQNSAMLAIPLFIFAGNLLNSCGITKRLIKLATLLTGHMRGGLAQVSVVLSTLMGGVSGSCTADAAMESRVLGPGMLEAGYSKGYTANTIAWTSLITATIPPGVGIIIYGTVGEVSIGRLFAAGLFVGILMMIILMVTVAITARLRGYKPARERRATLREIAGSLGETVWALIFPILLLFGIRLGMFTPSEVGAFACIYAVLVGVFVYRELKWKSFLATLRDTVQDIGAVMFIIALSGIFGYGIPFDQVPVRLTGFMLGISDNRYVLIFMIILFLIVLGMFMEGSVTILLLTPIFLPLMRELGVDPVFFGLIMCTIITLGNNTPPVGISMYTVNGIIGCSTGEYIREMWPFFGAVLLEVCILVFFPDAVMFIPNLLFG